MSYLFPQIAYHSGLNPLMRLLEDPEGCARDVQEHLDRFQRQSRLPTVNPRFDVREAENQYELHGELPGVDKKNVHIEFTEPQTITIRGRVERSYTSPSESEAALAAEEVKPQAQVEAATHHATVEDEDGVVVQHNSKPSSPTPNKATTEVAKASPQDVKRQTRNTSAPKFWVSERSVGEFFRTFNFAKPVDHNAVSASLNNGILKVTVPKAKKNESRRVISVN